MFNHRIRNCQNDTKQIMIFSLKSVPSFIHDGNITTASHFCVISRIMTLLVFLISVHNNIITILYIYKRIHCYYNVIGFITHCFITDQHFF